MFLTRVSVLCRLAPAELRVWLADVAGILDGFREAAAAIEAAAELLLAAPPASPSQAAPYQRDISTCGAVVSLVGGSDWLRLQAEHRPNFALDVMAIAIE